MISKAKAKEVCLELWKWCAETGKYKTEWPGWEDYPEYKYASCPFCSYARRAERRGGYIKPTCSFCPYVQRFGYDCMDKRSAYYPMHKGGDYTKAGSRRFYNQLKQC